MQSAVQAFLNNSIFRHGLHFVLSAARQEMDRIYQLFIRQYGMSILSDDAEHFEAIYGETVTGNKLLTDESVRALLASLSIPFSGCPFEPRFEIAMSSNGWPAETFWGFLQCDNPLRLATKTDAL